jgi:sulfate adenylyltransferase
VGCHGLARLQTNEAQKVLGTTDLTHPAVSYLVNNAGDVYLGGKIEGVRLPQHFDFNEVRLTPAQVREKMDKLGWSRFVAFQTRNPMHRAHIELTRVAANEVGVDSWRSQI